MPINSPPRHRLARLAVVVPVLVLGLGACGSGGDGTAAEVASLSDETTAPDGTEPAQPKSPEDAQEAALEFAKCMREHGVDMPDPQFDAGGARGAIAIELPDATDRTAVEEAQKACGDLLGAAAGSFTPPDPEEQARFQEAMLAYAQCMRDHGIDFPDPQMDGGMVQIGGEGIDPGDAGFQEADKACRDLLPGGEGRVTAGSRAGGAGE